MQHILRSIRRRQRFFFFLLALALFSKLFLVGPSAFRTSTVPPPHVSFCLSCFHFSLGVLCQSLVCYAFSMFVQSTSIFQLWFVYRLAIVQWSPDLLISDIVLPFNIKDPSQATVYNHLQVLLCCLCHSPCFRDME